MQCTGMKLLNNTVFDLIKKFLIEISLLVDISKFWNFKFD